MKLRSKFVVGFFASCLVSLPGRVRAADSLDSDTRAAARQLGYSGVEAFQAGDYAAASEKLDKAYRVAGVPSLGLWSARALAKVGKLVEASERYLEVTQLKIAGGDQAVQKKAQTDAAAELAALRPRIPNLTVQVEGAQKSELTLTLDGNPMPWTLIGEPRPVNPGVHQIHAARGDEHVTVEVTLAEADQKPALLKFAAAPGSPPPPNSQVAIQPPRKGLGTQRTLALVAGGIGLVGVGVGTVFGLKSKGSHDEAAKYCTGAVCTDQRGVNAGQDAYSAGTVSTVGMVIGALGLAGGAALWFTAPRAQERASAALGLGFGSVEARGTF